jgi:excisionase family DNA binding protein
MDLIFPHDEVAGLVLDQHISVKAAAEFSGYKVQYLRRLLRNGHLQGIKIGQVWLIKLASLDAYLKRATCMGDRRCGPRAVLGEGTNNATEALSTIVNAARKQV